ncbi:phosphate ABC transporter permease PstA [Glaciecola sp. 2405UD65-10]|uniref:phosphate ABC transporter permease PstA n=1 Tax=Glaciecola sp. 2405UD65-10 TaxID=3397244 RepID=UPI003B595716
MALSIYQNKSNDDYQEQFKQSLVEVCVMLACSILLLLLLSLFVFVALQGGRYFLPMSVFEVRTSITEHNGAQYTPLAPNTHIEYVLSHDSKLEVRRMFEKKNEAYTNLALAEELVLEVYKPDDVYLLNTRAGKKYLGKFSSIQLGEKILSDLSQFDEITTTVNTLSRNLSDIQLSKLKPLHETIGDFTDKGVGIETPMFQRKLAEFRRWQQYANNIRDQIQSHRINIRIDSQDELSIAFIDVVEFYQPNAFSNWDAIAYTFKQLYIFLTESPKQASTSGGVFPAIFGTLLMVILMAVFVTPFGAIAAIYLHEYAPATRLTTFIRISVSNMAAVPSVVYGVFGLGFFVYGMGGTIDQLLFSQSLPSPTFGTPGLLWAALTMGILTLPVVIVSTEEGLKRVPKNLRAGALALGATKYETIRRVVLPMASPGILTGVILAIARAAGEVAPLILVGAVKFAPSLPIDSEFPFIHLERQFMHLGVFIYDGAFHNQTESQVSSLMFATCLLLLLIVFFLNVSAIILRNKLRNKYKRI